MIQQLVQIDKWILAFVNFFSFPTRKQDIPWKDPGWQNEQFSDPRRQISSFSCISWMLFKHLSWPAIADHRKNVLFMNCCMSWHIIQLLAIKQKQVLYQESCHHIGNINYMFQYCAWPPLIWPWVVLLLTWLSGWVKYQEIIWFEKRIPRKVR